MATGGDRRNSLGRAVVLAGIVALLALGALPLSAGRAPPVPPTPPAPTCGGAASCARSVEGAGVEPPQWRELSSPGHPAIPPRAYAAAAFDPALGAVVVFGGQSATGGPLGDTWEFAHGTWSTAGGEGAGPAARWGSTLAYDVATGRLLLFGGTNGSSAFGDLWSFNGSGWHALPDPGGPSPRTGAAAAYDPAFNALLVFGGNSDGRTLNDTWLYTQHGWASFQPGVGSTPVPPLAGPVASYDPHTLALWLTGAPADAPAGGSSQGLWSLAGGTWRAATGSAATPRARDASLFVADPSQGELVLFGGSPAGPLVGPAFLGDTWSFSAGLWTNRSSGPGPAPSPRTGAAGAFDPLGGGLLLIGGLSATGVLADVWTYSPQPMVVTVSGSPTAGPVPLPTAFTVSVSGGVPPYTPRWEFGDGAAAVSGFNTSHTYSSVGSFVAQFTITDSVGTSSTTDVPIDALTGWEATHQWGELSVPAARAPSPRWSAQIAYDPSSEAVVLFGGELAGGAAAGDTWEFVGGVWFNLTSNLSVSPAPRWGGALAYDPIGGSLVLFGGTNGQTTFNDTWTYSPGTGWMDLPTSTAPSPRYLSAFVSDPDFGGAVLFGGALRAPSGSWTVYNDTWEFEAGDWYDLSSSVGPAPPPTLGAAASYDAPLGELLIFGGSALPPGGTPGTCYPDSELWAFVGGKWVEATSSTAPGVRLLSASAFDSSIGASILFGGAEATGTGCTAGSDTWSYSDANWTNLSSGIAAGPPARSSAAAAFDPAAGVMVLFGGDSNGAALNDTWVFPALLNQSSTSITIQSVVSPGGSIGTTGTTTGTSGGSTGGPPGPLTVGYSISGAGQSAPDAVQFSATVTGGTPPYTDAWYFGDSSPTADGANVSHTYQGAGTYEASLTVTDAIGSTVTELVGPINVSSPHILPTSPSTLGPGPAPASWVFPALAAAGVTVVVAAFLVEARQRRLKREGEELVRDIEHTKNP